MKIVVDTNVLVSGLLNPFGASAEIVRMISAGTLKLCYDARIIAEYQEVLLREKFQFKEPHVNALLEQVKFCGELTAAGPLAKHLPDVHDEVFLETAVAAQAEYLVTGNIKHYPGDKRQGINVVSPKDFLEIYRKI